MRNATRPTGRDTHDAFPLRTVAAMTGLTPDVIRAWEKRYAVVAPIRGARGARLYTSADIAHLRLLARVVGAGRAIGDVAALKRKELEKLAASSAADSDGAERPSATPTGEDFVARVLGRLEAFDYASVLGSLGDAVVGLGARGFVYEVALPLVRLVGSRWAEGQLSIAEEHLVSGILRNLLAGLIHNRRGGGRPVLLATPVGERHELGLLMVAVLALDAGANVVYLGMDLPAAEIVTAATRMHARIVGISAVTAKNRSRAIDEARAIQSGLPRDTELWVGGADAAGAVAGVKAFRGLVLDSLSAAEAELMRIAAETPVQMKIARGRQTRAPRQSRVAVRGLVQ